MIGNFAMKFIIGHGVGDYLFQNNFMALNKVRNDLTGYLACALHSFIYAIVFSGCVGAGVMTLGRLPWLVLFIFLTHFPIDKWSLGKFWMEKLLKKKFPDPTETPITMSQRMFHVLFFSDFVYVIVDNTMHFVLMYYGIKFFFPELMV